MKWIKIIMVGACVLAAVGVSYGGILYQQDFQSYSNGATGFIGSGNGWTGTGMTSGQTNSIGGVGSLFTANTPSLRSLYVNDNITTNPLNQTLIYSSTNSGATSISNNGNVKISFDFNIRSNGAPGSAGVTPTFDLRAGNAWVATLNLGGTTNRYFQNFVTNASSISSVSVSTANWYRIEMTIGDLSTATDTYNLKVWQAAPAGGYNQAGTLVVDLTNVAMRVNASYFDGFDFRTQSTNTASLYNIDNISVVTIPEPATIGMLVFGAGGLVLIRRQLAGR
ncbi:MAG: PEP-CTERM sorting domain-containing protein [Kiritimatiellaceae bacterium]|nr:PEP-CTERM sorting domain-containing protein [Kiritimatiellaceae bacterium]